MARNAQTRASSESQQGNKEEDQRRKAKIAPLFFAKIETNADRHKACTQTLRDIQEKERERDVRETERKANQEHENGTTVLSG